MKIVSSSVVFLSILLPSLGLGQQTPQSLADAELPSLLAIYKDIHTHPELSGHEERTASLVAKELRAAGCQVTEHLGKYENSQLIGYGVVGVMKNGDGPITITLQAELPRLGNGGHRLRFRNDYATAGSVYLANALVPDTPRIAITSQDRDAVQHELTIAFTVVAARSSVDQLSWIAVAGVLLLALLLARRSARSRRLLLSDERRRHIGAAGPGMFLGDVS